VYYSCRYKYNGNDFVITYSLDNYIKIQGMINGEYINDAGYVIDYNNVVVNGNKVTYRGYDIEVEKLVEYVGSNNIPDNEKGYAKIGGIKYYKENENQVFYILNGKRLDLYGDTAQRYIDYIDNNESAKNYYKEAKEFTERLIDQYGLSELKVSNAYITNSNGDSEQLNANNNTKIFAETDDNTILEPDSNFNSHRLAVIRKSIETNLATAIAGFNNVSGSSTNFQMPKLKETEWELVLNNICVISFLQGLNIGGKVYNGYTVIPNNKTKEIVTENSIYITADDIYYYKVMDNELLSKNIGKGYFNLDFEVASINGNDGKKIYYYPKTQLGSYTSIVGSTGISPNWNGNVYEYLKDPNGDGSLSDVEKALAQAYYTALGRERYSMHRY